MAEHCMQHFPSTLPQSVPIWSSPQTPTIYNVIFTLTNVFPNVLQSDFFLHLSSVLPFSFYFPPSAATITTLQHCFLLQVSSQLLWESQVFGIARCVIITVAIVAPPPPAPSPILYLAAFFTEVSLAYSSGKESLNSPASGAPPHVFSWIWQEMQLALGCHCF